MAKNVRPKKEHRDKFTYEDAEEVKLITDTTEKDVQKLKVHKLKEKK